MTTAQIIDYLIKLCGLLGVGGMIVFLITRKINKSDERREALERARLESDIINSDGLCCLGNLAEATAIAVRDGKTNGETKHALDEYKMWRGRRESFIQRQAAEHLRGEAG